MTMVPRACWSLVTALALMCTWAPRRVAAQNPCFEAIALPPLVSQAMPDLKAASIDALTKTRPLPDVKSTALGTGASATLKDLVSRALPSGGRAAALPDLRTSRIPTANRSEILPPLNAIAVPSRHSEGEPILVFRTLALPDLVTTVCPTQP